MTAHRMEPRQSARGKAIPIAIATCMLTLPLLATDYDWTGATDKKLTTATNWSPSGPPSGTGDTATIQNPSTEDEVRVDSSGIKLGRLLVGNGHTLHLKYGLDVERNSDDPAEVNDGRLEFEGDVIVDTNGSSSGTQILACHFIRIYAASDTVVEFTTDGDTAGIIDACSPECQ